MVLFSVNNIRITWCIFIKLHADNLELVVAPSFNFVTSSYQQYQLICVRISDPTLWNLGRISIYKKIGVNYSLYADNYNRGYSVNIWHQIWQI